MACHFTSGQKGSSSEKLENSHECTKYWVKRVIMSIVVKELESRPSSPLTNYET